MQYREDSISYIRAELPLDSIEAAAQLSSVQGLEVDQTVPLPDPSTETEPAGVLGIIPQPVPGAGTPRVNPYMPNTDIGAAEFVDANPAYDGRGVTIGIVDSGITLDHPSLLTTSTGERKIIDWVTGTDPLSENDPTWLDMANVVYGSVFSFMRSPTPHRPKRNSVSRCSTNAILAWAARPAEMSTATATRLAAAACSRSCGIPTRTWCMSTPTRTITSPMTDYKVNYDVNYFGVDNPASPVAGGSGWKCLMKLERTALNKQPHTLTSAELVRQASRQAEAYQPQGCFAPAEPMRSQAQPLVRSSQWRALISGR